MIGVPGGRRLVAGVVTLLAVLFPGLAAGAGIDQPARPSELAWIEFAADDPTAEKGGPASLYVRATIDAAAVVAGSDAAPRRMLPKARLASVLGVLACSGLLYLAVALAHGRGIAALACLVFGLLPPVWSEGAILRPEVPTCVFGLLGLVLLLGLPERLRPARRQGAAVWVPIAGIALAVATADALAVATMPRYGIYLIVPALCLAIAVVQQSAAFLRVLRRFRALVLPFRGFVRRTLPWLMPPFFALAVAALVMTVARGPERVTLAQHGLLPAAPLAAIPLIALAVLGGVARLLHVGFRIARRPRIGPEVVLAVFVLALLVHRLRLDAIDDALPAAPALAVLVADGAAIALLFAAARLGGLRARTR